MDRSIISESALVALLALTGTSNDVATPKIIEITPIATPLMTKFHAPEVQPLRIVYRPRMKPAPLSGSPAIRPKVMQSDCRRRRAWRRGIKTLTSGLIARHAIPNSSQYASEGVVMDFLL